MHGQVVVMTGATSGIGEVTALALAARGARVVFVARDAARGNALLARLQAANPGVEHALHLADLGLLMHQQAVAQAIAGSEPRIDVLLNNAGAVFMAAPRTAEGFAPSFVLNHLAYYTLTLPLLPALRAAGAARIVCTSSRAHRYAPVLPGDFGLEALQLDGIRGYALSKLCNIWFTRALARRLADGAATVNALHPGFVATRFADNTPWLWRTLMGWRKRTHGRTPARGADTLTWLATAPEVAGKSGGYWADRAPGVLSAAAQDEVAAERLWRLTAGLTGLDLPLPATHQRLRAVLRP
jgi:NAD(P)-dependent dehydrogenase (short-subunit alcohol dehydrogenase family)